MKRIGLAVACLSALMLLTGCGSEKQLECTTSKEESGVSLSQVYTLKFDSRNRFKSATLTQDMKASEENFESLKKLADTQFKGDQFKDLNPELSDNGKDTVTVKMNFNDKELEELTQSKTSSADYEAVKSELEKMGYTCK